jgi:hypothetical protein
VAQVQVAQDAAPDGGRVDGQNLQQEHKAQYIEPAAACMQQHNYSALRWRTLSCAPGQVGADQIHVYQVLYLHCWHN